MTADPRSGLVAALRAARDGPAAEAAAWAEPLDGVPGWFRIAHWCLTRWAEAKAEAEGYAYSTAAVVAHALETMAAERGKPETRPTADGSAVLFAYPDGSWLAFERAPYVETGLGGWARAQRWRQLVAEPDPNGRGDVFRPGDAASEAVEDIDLEFSASADGLAWERLDEEADVVPLATLHASLDCPDCHGGKLRWLPCARPPWAVSSAAEHGHPEPCASCGHEALFHAGPDPRAGIGMQVEAVPQAGRWVVVAGAAISHPCCSEGCACQGYSWVEAPSAPVAERVSVPGDDALGSLGLPGRVVSALRGSGIDRVPQLAAMTRKELGAVRRLGRMGLAEVLGALSVRGLALRDA